MVNVKDFHVDKENEGAHWWCKALVKVVAVIAAFVCGISGLVTCFTSVLAPICIPAGLIMLGNAFLLILFEAPVCCMFFESTHKVSDWLQKRKYWQKGLLYIILSVIPVIMCQGISVIIGCLCSFAVGTIYGLMSLGKKASQKEMQARTGDADTQQFANVNE